MAYRPGSFSKNFAWHGAGLGKLHAAVREGFQGRLAVVDRHAFRDNAGVARDIVLIPLNFFLHNLRGQLSVDELVWQAVALEHSTHFDRLALFALNLSQSGSGRDAHSHREIVPRPAMWANEFLRERLWDNGLWQSDALSDGSLDQFLADRMDAQPEVRVKCRNNYRHMFQLCRYRTTRGGAINSGAETWVSSALFLAWDRHILDGGASDDETLVELVEGEELYRLLGVPVSQAVSWAATFVKLYNEVGRLDRFQADANYWGGQGREVAVEAREDSDTQWLEQGEADQVVERRAVERSEQKRDRTLAAALKQLYGNACQFCGVRLEVAENRFYSEAAHIKALGGPHNGPDTSTNILVLCPNHHLQFDRGVLRLERVGRQLLVRSKARGDPLDGANVDLKHRVVEDYIRYHYDWFESP